MPERDLDALVEEALNSKEPIKKPKAEKLRPQGLLERIVLSNWTAPLFAAAISAVAYTTPQSPPADVTENLTAYVMIGGFSYATAKLIRQDWLVRKAEAVRRKVRPLPFKLLNLFSEHPEIIAGGASAYFTANLVSPMFTSITASDLFKHLAVVPIVARLSAFLSPTFFVMAYPAVSLSLGRIFHPETAKTLFKASAAVLNAYRGKHKEAANNLSQLLENQRSYTKTVALQTLIGDLQMLAENLKCFDTYTVAISTEKTSYVGRSDWVLGPFISFIKNSVVKKAKIPRWAEAGDLSYLVAATHAFSERQLESADMLFSAAVNKAREGFAAHAARAAFLRTTGRHKTADLEVMVCAEILMRERNVEFERVEEMSRNEVFFAANLALKRNIDPLPLEKERAIIAKFRERFGQSVIYPLPVYKRGDFYYLLSEKDISETLLDLIRQKKARFEDFAQAIQLLVQFQKFGLDLYKAGELPLDDRILQISPAKPETMYFTSRRQQAMQQIERFNGVKLPESYKAAVGHGLAFVDKVLASSPFLTMYKDFNPKNVLKKLFGQMQVLDFEPRSLKLLPPQVDIGNLLEFTEYLSPEQIDRLLDLAADAFAAENRVKVDKEKFRVVYEYAMLQWHYERLIYRPEEAALAKTEEQREAKRKEQVRHVLKAREHLNTMLDRQYVRETDLEAALEAKKELELPIFSEAEWQRLEDAVNSERQSALMHEPLPMGKARLAAASLAVPAIIAASVFGAVVVKNNLVPGLNVPVFPQGDKVLLSVSRVEPGGRSIEVPGQRSIDYYVLDATDDKLRFLTAADTARSAGLSAFQDKAVFVLDGHITLYDFIKEEFRTVKDDRFENPTISPNGLWIAANLSNKYISQNNGEIWLIRPADMKTRQTADVQNSFSPTWSMDGSYLAFLSNNEPVPGKSYADPLKVWINTKNLSSGEIYTGPLISEMRRGILAWSSNSSLAYIVERKEEKQTIQLSDQQFKAAKEIYVEGNRDMLGYKTEGINSILFAGPDHLLIQSTLSNDYGKGFAFIVSLLDLKSLEMITLANPGFIGGVSKDGSRVLYTCSDPADICEFNIKAGQRKNLTNTPNLQEAAAVYSLGGNKIYVVAYPALDCSKESCPPSLFVIDPLTGKPKLLRHETDGSLRYGLTTP